MGCRWLGNNVVGSWEPRWGWYRESFLMVLTPAYDGCCSFFRENSAVWSRFQCRSPRKFGGHSKRVCPARLMNVRPEPTSTGSSSPRRTLLGATRKALRFAAMRAYLLYLYARFRTPVRFGIDDGCVSMQSLLRESVSVYSRYTPEGGLST